jgi:hypothetical protein
MGPARAGRARVPPSSGETRTAVNIRIEPQPHDQFLPPPNAAVAEQPGFGGSMSFSAVVLQVAFAGRPASEILTMEETAFDLKTPAGLQLTLVTAITDYDRNLVRIRVLANAKGSPGNVKGELLDEVTAALGSTVETTRLGETMTIKVTRVRGQAAR